jgi:hypothetical protein
LYPEGYTFDMNPTNHEYPNLIAFVAGADNALGEALVGRLLMKGWRVFAGHTNPDCSDLPKLTRHLLYVENGIEYVHQIAL